MGPSAVALLKDVFFEKSIRFVQAESRRRLERELERVRPGSFPFVSADTFRSVADVVIEKKQLVRRSRLYRRTIIFFDLALVDDKKTEVRALDEFVALNREISNCDVKPVLVLHNGDIPLSGAVLQDLEARVHHIFSTNVVEGSTRLTPIPVGIENSYRNNNGVLADFIDFRNGQPGVRRDNMVTANFNPATNLTARGPLVQALSDSRFGWDSSRISPREYRRRVVDSRFVLSPPGNGIDCHRTWEAIYLGAVPVVLRSLTPQMFVEDLPILAVDHFSDFLGLADSQMMSHFDRVRRTSSEKAFMPHWLSLLEAQANFPGMDS